MQSFIEPHLASMANGEWLNDDDKAALDELVMGNTQWRERVVSLKVWRPDGVIIYSPDRELIGDQYPVDDDLGAALNGEIHAEMSNLQAQENVSEQGFDHLLEMYLPVRERGTNHIIAVAEFYQMPTEIDQEVASAQITSWAVVAVAVALAYMLLFGIVRRGNDTIVRQQQALRLAGDRTVDPSRPERAAARPSQDGRATNDDALASATCGGSAAISTMDPGRCSRWR